MLVPSTTPWLGALKGGAVFRSDTDRNHFLDRLGEIVEDTKTICYAWALIPNHFHLLLRTRRVLASGEEVMERRYGLRARGVDLGTIALRVSEVLAVKPEEVWAEGKYRADCRGQEPIVLLGGEGTGGTHVFHGAKAEDIDSVCE